MDARSCQSTRGHPSRAAVAAGRLQPTRAAREPLITDIQPFRGLRYDPSAVDADSVLAPPYDVVSDAQVEALMRRSPHNIAHIESCPGPEEERYERAARLLDEWRKQGVLRRDPRPAYYVYEQRAQVLGETVVRRQFFARMRLYPYEAGVVRPHEATLEGPKEQRLRLQRATRANISPIFVMYPDPAGEARAVLERVCATPPAFEGRDVVGDQHRVWMLDDEAACSALTAVVERSNVTIADGHHRYATALNYLAERGGESLPADAPERWVLAGMVAAEEPGLVVLPNHRLVRDVPDDLLARLSDLYDVEDLTPDPWDPAVVQRLWERVQANAHGPTTFGLLGPGRTARLLTARSREAIDAAMPQDRAPASRRLDVLVLMETILAPVLGLDQATVARSDRVAFTEVPAEAWAAVERGDADIALLLNPVRVEQIIDVADAGEVLPQKATFFYPKLATGVVLNPLDE